MSSVWLVFLFYPIMALVQSTAQLPWLVLGWVALVAFAGSYITEFLIGGGPVRRRVSRLEYTLLVIMVLATIALVPAAGANAMSTFPFLVSVLAYQYPRPLFITGAVLGVGIMGAYELVGPDRADFVPLFVVQCIVTLVHAVTVWFIARSAEADRLELELATSEERENVARDVHDLLGHSLTVVKLKAQLARKLVDADPARAKTELEEIERITAEAIAGVRATVTGLRSVDFGPQLAAGRAALQAAGIRSELRGDLRDLSPAQSLPAGWVLREATTNVLRHSGASLLRVTVAPGRVTIEDDGKGLPSPASSGDAAGPGAGGAATSVPDAVGPGAAAGGAVDAGCEGNGLHGMRERAAAAGATFSIDRSELGGVRIRLSW